MSFLRKRSGPQVDPTWLIVGLGNPGPAYRGTRHNVGFDVIDRLAEKHKIKVQTSRYKAIYGTGTINGEPVCLVKPLTYMNLSGQAVQELLKHYRVGIDRVLIIADDLDLTVGRVRLKPKGSSGGHNGHKSLIASLGSDEYPRIKIGIGKAGETIDHVLGKFHPDEKPEIDSALRRSVECVERILDSGLESAMNWVNTGS